MAEQAGKLALRALRAFNLKPVSPDAPATPQPQSPLSSQGNPKSPFFSPPGPSRPSIWPRQARMIVVKAADSMHERVVPFAGAKVAGVRKQVSSNASSKVHCAAAVL